MGPPDEHPSQKQAEAATPPSDTTSPSGTPPQTLEVKPADLKSWLSGKLALRLGAKWGRIVCGLIVLVVMGWWQWEMIHKLPGVLHLLTWWSQEALPTADPKRFSVAIAHLERDKEHEHEELLVHELGNFAGIQILRFDRTIATAKGSQPEQAELQGHAKAREYLAQTGADVLIWGIVHHLAGREAPRLYWTTASNSRRWTAARPMEDFKLPDFFWEDLVDVLRLLVVTQETEFTSQQGHFIGHQLAPFIQKVRTLLGKSSGQLGWRSDTLVQVQIILANALSAYSTDSCHPVHRKVATQST